MAEVTTERVDLFPAGTSIKAFPKNQFHTGTTITPPLGSTNVSAEATMTSGKATFTGLTAGTPYYLYAEVASEARYLLVYVPAAATNTATLGLAAQPTGNSFLGWAFDPLLMSGTAKILVSGTLTVAKIAVPEAATVKNVHCFIAKAGATLTAGQSRLGLFNEQRKLVGETAAAATITAYELVEKEAKVALETAVTLPAGAAYVGVYCVGTTPPELGLAGSATKKESDMANANVETTKSRFATANTGLTTAMPSEIGTMTAAPFPFWAAVS